MNSLHTVLDQKIDGAPSARTWFAGGERVGYDPKAGAIVAGRGAPLKVFLKREGDLAHAVSFLPGYPDGSFGWARFCRIYRTQARCPNSSSNMSAWAIATSPKTIRIPPQNGLISLKRFGARTS